jgi:hypothetical protein
MTILLFVFLRHTASDYPFGIFKAFSSNLFATLYRIPGESWNAFYISRAPEFTIDLK